MKYVKKVQPAEAEKVESETPVASRKRRRSRSFYEFTEAHDSTQSTLSSYRTLSLPDLRPAVPLTAKQLAKLTPKYVNDNADRVRAMCDKDQPFTQDETILRQESTVRSNLACTIHELACQLKMYDTLFAEHEAIKVKVKDRNLTILDDGLATQ